MTSRQDEYDVIVVGGGPAGSTVAALVAEAGFSTLLVERDREPRRKVGESLMPDTYWVFERLGLVEKLKKSSFMQKVGVQFVNSTQKESSPFLFTRHDPRVGRTWHVERAKFDPFLLENAAEKGAEILRGVRALEVAFEGERAAGVRLAPNADDSAAGESRVVRSRVLVDATGQQGLLGARFNLRIPDKEFRKAAIWGHFRGAKRETIDDGVMTLVLRTMHSDTWFWHIPLSNDIVSVGAVGAADTFFKGRGTPEAIFQEEVDDCPSIAQRLAGAEMVAGLDVVKEYSYRTTQSAGDGWVLVGDSWGFIDPLYSSGVFFALKSGQLAADAVIEGLGKDDTSADQLGKWTHDFNIGVNWVRKLVRAYYTGYFRVGRFVREYPQHIGPMTDILIGRIFHPTAGDMFDDLDPFLERMRAEGVLY
jgi:flavin-dependent dehydrogenase